MYSIEKEPPSYQDSQSSVTDPCAMPMSPSYVTCIIGEIAHTLNFPDHYRLPSQRSTPTDSSDEGSLCSGGPAQSLQFYASRPFGPPPNEYVPFCVQTVPPPPSNSWNASSTTYPVSRKSRSSSSAYRDIGLVHSFPATAQSVGRVTSNSPLRTPQTRDSSTDEHDGDLEKQMSEGTYRPTVSTSAIQRAASHRRKHKAKFTCPHPNCDSSFTTARNRQNHINSHRNAKNFTCSVCHLAMATRSNVLRHGKKQHPGQDIRAETRA